MAIVEVIDSDFIFTTDEQRVLVAVEDDGTVRLVFSSRDGAERENVYTHLSPADAHLLGTKLRLAAKKVASG